MEKYIIVLVILSLLLYVFIFVCILIAGPPDPRTPRGAHRSRI